MSKKTVGVIGAGVMGSGVAQNLAQKNFNVVLIDITDEALEKARTNIHNSVRFQAFMQKDKSKLDSPETILERIEFTKDYEPLKDAWYVIENVVEKWEAKSEVYPRLDEVCPENTVFAVDTSCYSITRVGALTKRPDKVIGIHFMNPVPMKPTVEVIKGWHTSEETIEITKEMLTGMGKDWVIVNDSPGFVSNRVLMLTINEAVFLLQEDVAKAKDVDDIFKKCFGHKMGPLETADLIGLDTILYSIEVLHESFNDSKYRPCALLKKMVDAGLLGRKSGKGFYSY
ncbi:3-hydroxybutyryl-CoA dehydrogenase [Desulfamplus magnetovallimortis]|uniref:3-hydroxybutyryl-CoA dehydrogenase n=1 Tax=Desulfamplus magnetovallimortis TaxID=1246637 RepID=A0A1W1HKV0_9BACT|nr:3-hydroxyacyl-CoA dehydrogenase NAD-binding domain-containing protein [Desulfamplus magnetovallimortis]SLM33104.1 3-hydroxybutyryl-CoA dehydrogenase [Desulfamplus magnetovallimortis]